MFTSPQQREILNQQRAQGKMFSTEPKKISQTKKLPNAVTVTEQRVFFNGYVIRKSGQNTAWANHQMLPNNGDTPSNGISAKLDHIKGTSVPVKPSTASRSIRIQPGQSISLKTGEITERYQQHKILPTKTLTNTSFPGTSESPQSTKHIEEPENPQEDE